MDQGYSLSKRFLLVLCGICLVSLPVLAQTTYTIYPVDNSADRYTIYTDPNTGLPVKLGGFSGLAPAYGCPTGNLLFVITDRGAGADGPGEVGKALANPAYSPSILTVFLKNGEKGEILRVLPLRKPNNEPVTGIAVGTEEDPFTDLSQNPLEHDPDGFDTEGIAAGPCGTFVVSDEYMPSVAVVSPSGHVLLRLAPAGVPTGAEKILTMPALPAVFTKRVPNRGLEAVALTPDGIVYTMFQRPLANPDKATSESSRNIRIAEIDLKKIICGAEGAVRQLLYITEKAYVDPTAVPPIKNRLKDIYVNDMMYYAPGVLLLTERSSKGKLLGQVFAIDVSAATDITGFEDSSGNLISDPTKTIEKLTPAELAALGIQPVAKKTFLSLDDLMASDANLAKIEGLTIAGGNLVLCPDNDFDILSADWSTIPATVVHFEPTNVPRIITTPLPEFSMD